MNKSLSRLDSENVCLGWAMNKKVCLGWAVNISLLVVNLREINEFANVTLACEHGQQIEAHKVIPAASSPFFQNLLKRNRIFVRGL